MHDYGCIPMEPAFSLGGIRVGNVVKWPKGAVIRAEHEGVGLSRCWFQIAEDINSGWTDLTPTLR